MSSHEEDHVVSALADLCKAKGVRTLIQVGAGDGYEADAVFRATGCKAIAIEGNSACAPYSRDIEHHAGLLIGATDCVATFYVHGTADLSSTLRREGENQQAIEVEMARLDTFCLLCDLDRNHEGVIRGIVPDALIIDTEGTTLDVLNGCGRLLDGLKIVYAECATGTFRPGVQLVGDVDALLVAHGMTAHQGLPSYNCGGQGNFTWATP